MKGNWGPLSLGSTAWYEPRKVRLLVYHQRFYSHCSHPKSFLKKDLSTPSSVFLSLVLVHKHSPSFPPSPGNDLSPARSLPTSHTARPTYGATYGLQAGESSAGPTMQYVCGECNQKVILGRGDAIRCKECGHRVLYKERTKR